MRQYREVGCCLPEDISTIRILNGRPYINVTTFQMIMVQLRGDPDTVAEQMGGGVGPIPDTSNPLPWPELLLAGVRIVWRIFHAKMVASRRFEELRTAGDQHRALSFSTHSSQQIRTCLETFRSQLPKGDITFAVSAGVSQLLTSMGDLLKKRAPTKWRSLLNASTQGFGEIISARQVGWLRELAILAEKDAELRHVLLSPSWDIQKILNMRKSSPFRLLLNRYIEEYGHRAIGESDVMTPRFSETPEYILRIIRGHLLTGTVQSSEAIIRQQTETRDLALTRLRKAFGWRIHEWLWFRLLHAKLSTYFELREANRHWLMYYLAGVRQGLLNLGRHFVSENTLATQDDVFFLTQDELLSLIGQPGQEWRPVVARRREERKKHATMTAPDFIQAQVHEGIKPSWVGHPEQGRTSSEEFAGLSISVGYIEGRVNVVHDPTDVGEYILGISSFWQCSIQVGLHYLGWPGA